MVNKKFQKDADSLLSTAYQKFDALFASIDSVVVSEWTVTHSLIYICKKYKEKFGMPFVLSYKGSPSTSPEYKLTARLWMMLGAKKGNGQLVKDYIDWFYHGYNSKSHFVSIGALTREATVAAFQKQRKITTKPVRSTPLPVLAKTIAQAFPETSYVKTWGDLLFLKEAMSEQDAPEVYKKMFDALESNGVDISVLSEII